MPRASDTFMTVVRENGAKVEIAINADEYKRVLKYGETEADGYHFGQTSGALPYSILLDHSLLGISFHGRRLIGGTRSIRAGADGAVLTMKLVHQKGGEMSLMVTTNEYMRVTAHLVANRQKNFTDSLYVGHDSKGREYLLVLGRETFSLSAEPVHGASA